MVTHQVHVRCRPGKVRRSKTEVLPLSYSTAVGAVKFIGQISCFRKSKMADGRHLEFLHTEVDIRPKQHY